MQSCSEGSRGLFVPWRVTGIFTDTTISPGSWRRQCSTHWTIRAGRNLPDKEFRYLRTVIVTAAVYWGFSRKLSIWQGPVFLLNSWLNHFTETTSLWYALSRSYSVNLPNSFSTAHPSALEYSSRLPVSVYGTSSYNLTLEVFLGSLITVTIYPAEAF
jgi:hypothetical protein